jgi:hypothetical protein
MSMAARPDSYAFSMTLARLQLARKGMNPDLLPAPPKESEYLRELSSPAPSQIYRNPDNLEN